MSYDWKEYNLTDNPFLFRPSINITAADRRLNGKLFCKSIVDREFKKLKRLIERDIYAIYVNSQESVLGTGKSALMAAVYWEIQNSKTAIWVESTAGYSASSILGRVVDSMVADGMFDEMLDFIGDVTFNRIKELLSTHYSKPSPIMINALLTIFSVETWEAPKKFANIRRSVLISSAIELFGYLLSLMMVCGYTKPIIFIDQFEEYVLAHRGPARLQKLGNEINDLLRAIQHKGILIFSLHPNAELILMSAAGEWVRTFAPITTQTMVNLRPMTENEAIELAAYYLNDYRIDKKMRDKIYPFSKNVLKYLINKTKFTRSYLTALHNSLVEGALNGYLKINEDFLSNDENHDNILLDASNTWVEFLATIKE